MTHPLSCHENGSSLTTMADSEGRSSDGSEYNRFADLAKRLVKVPKKELDEARRRDEAAKRTY